MSNSLVRVIIFCIKHFHTWKILQQSNSFRAIKLSTENIKKYPKPLENPTQTKTNQRPHTKIKVTNETPVRRIANVIAEHYDIVLSHTILPTASLHQCIKYFIPTCFLSALFHTLVTNHSPALVPKTELPVFSIFPMALKYLSASQILLCF